MAFVKNDLEKAISDELQIYAEKEYTHQLIAAMLSDERSSHASIPVDSMSLFESSVAFAHYIFRNPKKALNILDDAFRKVAQTISQNHAFKEDMVYRENLHARLVALPNLPEVYRSNLPGCSDVRQFLCIKGTVTRVSTAKMLQYKKLWRCGKCKHEFLVEAEIELGYICEKPLMCPNPEWCNGKNFTLMSTDINTDWCKDFQEIKLQEQVYSLSVGSVPKSMTVILENDLVESCHPGNDVIVSGILTQRWKPLWKGKPIDIELIILAHNIEVQNKMAIGVVSQEMANEFGQFWLNHKSDPLKARDFILSCICPQVFGLYIVKLAVALILAGGVHKKDGNSRIRGDSHLLLIGDPGTAKSQFLKYASKVTPRSVITSGIGTTNAGLTVSAIKIFKCGIGNEIIKLICCINSVKENFPVKLYSIFAKRESGHWQLEAGALVLADGGVCCIDEFSCIKEQDKTCIHEAMEQQTISVAKAGLVCSLSTKCSILAATNPKGAYDENLSISENTALGTPLLSRFDIILVLLDKNDENWDEMVSSYILQGRNFMTENDVLLWPAQKIKNYFSLIRQIKPQVTKEAERVLQAYYTRQRSLQARNASRTTPRLLQSLIRLAEGHARLMFRNKVLLSDAIVAIILIESSMVGFSILEGINPLLTIFPKNPAAEYEERANIVLKNLNISLEAKENYDQFYEESEVKNILFLISELLILKNKSFIFENTQNESIANFVTYKEKSYDDKTESEFTTSKSSRYLESLNPSEKDLTNTLTTGFKTNSNNVNTVTTDVEGTTSGAAKKCLTRISIKQRDIIRTSTQKPDGLTGMDNLSFLHQILEEDKSSEVTDSPKDKDDNLMTDQLSTLSDIENIFNNEPQKDQRAKYLDIPSETIAGSVIPQTQRTDSSLLLELGILPEKQDKESNSYKEQNVNSGRSSTKVEEPQISRNVTTSKSLADRLISFTFSKCKNASQGKNTNSQLSRTESTSASSKPNNDQPEIAKFELDCPNPLTTKHTFKMHEKDCKEKQRGNATMMKENLSSAPSTSKDRIFTDSSNNNLSKSTNATDQGKQPPEKIMNEPMKQDGLPAKRELPDKLKKFIFAKRQKTSNPES